MLVASWAEHVRQHGRTTKAETEIAERAWSLHAGEKEPVVRHYIKANRMSTPLGFGQFRRQNEVRASDATPKTGAPHDRLLGEPHRVSFRDIPHRNEPKTARLASFPVRDEFNFSNRAEWLKEFPQ
jgi:hypothetical protein